MTSAPSAKQCAEQPGAHRVDDADAQGDPDVATSPRLFPFYPTPQS